MSLREKLKALEELQQIDLEINDVRGQLEGIGPKRAAAEVSVVQAKKAWDEEKGRLESNERERRQLESLLAMERQKAKTWEGKLGDIRTPREYAAFSREIDILKKSNDAQGEQVKALGAQALDIQKALEQQGEALAEAEDAAEGQVKALAAQQAELEARRTSLEARRVESAKLVDPSLLAKYENIKRRRAGVAVTPVVGMTCKGCQRNIPPQLAITLQRANSIETCPNCNRIIYSAEAVNPPAASPA
ncbi:MAG: C4-type zinc ribbon domain-containing protein [Anaeromyxobacter sp.]